MPILGPTTTDITIEQAGKTIAIESRAPHNVGLPRNCHGDWPPGHGGNVNAAFKKALEQAAVKEQELLLAEAKKWSEKAQQGDSATLRHLDRYYGFVISRR